MANRAYSRRPWQERQIDVWVAEQTRKGNWLFGARAELPAEGSEQAWRHANLGDTRCVIHAEASVLPSALGWRGEAGQPFTNAMARVIVALIRDGVRLQSISPCSTSPSATWRKFKHGLDSGKTGLAGALAAAPAEDAVSGGDARAGSGFGDLGEACSTARSISTSGCSA